MLSKKNKKKEIKVPHLDYYNAKRKGIINLSEAKRNLYGSKPKKRKTL